MREKDDPSIIDVELLRFSRKTWKVDKVIDKIQNAIPCGISSDGDFIIYDVEESAQSDIWMIKNFDLDY